MDVQRWWFRRTSVLLLALIALVGCEPPWVVDLEQPMEEVPEAYSIWFKQVAHCMGMDAEATEERFSVIRWYQGVEIRNPSEGKYALGLWESPHKITIRSDLSEVDYVVKHELVHELLRDGSHNQEYFRMCAGV